MPAFCEQTEDRFRRIRIRLACVSQWLALAVYALAPLPFGSVDGPWMLVWITLLAISLLLADVSQVSPAAARILLMVYGIAAALIGLVGLQLWPIGAMGDALWTEASRQLDMPLAQRVSASASQPLFAIASPLLVIVAFARGILLGTDPDRVRSVPRVIGIAALGYAAYGLLVLASGTNMILWQDKTAHLDDLTATFPSRNTAAAYFGTAVLIWALDLQRQVHRHFQNAGNLSEVVHAAIASPWRLRLAAIAAVICFGALAATGSRAGLIVSGLALACGLIFRSAPKRWPWLGAIIVGLALLEIFGGRTVNRIDLQGLTDAGRRDVYVATLQMIAAHPLTGIGLGNFEAIFPSLRPVDLGSAGVWNRAHSTPLELTAELGLPFMALVIAFVAFAGIRLLRASLRSRAPIVVLALCTGLLGLLHTCVDYALQIPGYSVVFAGLTGVGLARACASPRKTCPAADPATVGAAP